MYRLHKACVQTVAGTRSLVSEMHVCMYVCTTELVGKTDVRAYANTHYEPCSPNLCVRTYVQTQWCSSAPRLHAGTSGYVIESTYMRACMSRRITGNHSMCVHAGHDILSNFGRCMNVCHYESNVFMHVYIHVLI